MERKRLFRSLSTYRKQGVSAGLMNGGGLITGCIFLVTGKQAYKLGKRTRLIRLMFSDVIISYKTLTYIMRSQKLSDMRRAPSLPLRGTQLLTSSTLAFLDAIWSP